MEEKAQISANISTASSSRRPSQIQGPSSTQRDPSTYPWRYIGKVKGALFKDIKMIPFDPKVDVPHGVCFNCWEFGHSRQNCSEPDRLDHCRNCGRIGVKLKSCPRCSQAYWIYWQGTNYNKQKIESLTLEFTEVREKQGEYKTDNTVSTIHFDDVNPIPFDRHLDIPSSLCSNCWGPRHQGLCGNIRHHDRCFNCGRIGVHMATCPRCSEGYRRHCEKKIKDEINKVFTEVKENQDHNGKFHNADVQSVVTQNPDENLRKDKDYDYDGLIIDENEKFCELIGTSLAYLLLHSSNECN